MERSYYWDAVSDEIGKIFVREFSEKMKICEIGFSGGHFLEFLYEQGYKLLDGVEIRKEQYEKTLRRFEEKELKIRLINADILTINEKYDAVFSTGLIQCLDVETRKRFYEHFSRMARIAIFTVPVIVTDRNIGSDEKVAVDGCVEYSTGNIPYELSMYYQTVRTGRIEKRVTGLEEDFLYFVCSH